MFPWLENCLWRLLVALLSFGVEKGLLKEKLSFLDDPRREGVEGAGGTASFPSFARAVAERCAMSTNFVWVFVGMGGDGGGRLLDR